MISGAVIIYDHRYSLWRVWDEDKPRVLFCMLNPSTADAEQDDPTIRRCIGFAKAWGFGGIEVVNLFSYRATKPADLFKADYPNTDRSDMYIRQSAERAGLCVVAWGAQGACLGRDKEVLQMLGSCVCLGKTKEGFPRPSAVRQSGHAAGALSVACINVSRLVDVHQYHHRMIC